TAASASTTIQPSGHCVASPSAERTISSLVPTAAANEPPLCTHSSKPQSSTVSIQRPTYAMSSPASPIMQSTVSPNFCRGFGSQPIKSIEQPNGPLPSGYCSHAQNALPSEIAHEGQERCHQGCQSIR